MNLSKALTDVISERHRQIEYEGWTARHDDEHVEGELVEAAICYASHGRNYALFDIDPVAYRDARPFPRDRKIFGLGDITWPKNWSWDWWKPKNPRRDLVRAAALIVAEIDKLDRAELATWRGRTHGGVRL